VLRPLTTAVVWSRTEHVETPFVAVVEGRRWLLQLGDFPAEPLYTLVVDGVEIVSFDDWPVLWTRPSRPD
jgi:hypothetical protein